jgi:3-oxoacyl-[acyl-carrier-protein] synthase II
MKRRVVITGLGVISSVGIGWKEFWQSLLDGRSGISHVSSFDTSNHFTHNAGEVKKFCSEEFMSREKMRELSRASQFALAAARLAAGDAGLAAENLAVLNAGICLGTTMGSVQTVERINEIVVGGKKDHFPDELICQVPTHSAPSAVSTLFNLRGPSLMFSTACSAGNYAIGYGFDLIRAGRADLIFAGGAEPLSKVAFTGFNQFKAVAPEKCQPFDLNRKGMMVAEGAGILILESLENALARNAHIYAEVLGYGLSCDAYHMTTSTVEGIAQCMKKAMREAGVTAGDIDYISAHGTGTLTNDKNECAAIREVFGPRYREIPVSSIKSMLGHTMGAASALEAIACALAVANNVIPPTINYETPDPECDIDCVPNQRRNMTVNVVLNNSYAFGGNNATAVLRKYNG